MGEFGFKELSIRNWLEPDNVMRAFATVSSDGRVEHLIGADWLDKVLEPSLSDRVPKKVQLLFEVARGAHAYGYFFYPLYTLAAEQLYTVAEAAIRHRCESLGAPPSLRNFVHKINWLADRGAIREDDREEWHTIRRLRNSASHPEGQAIITPGLALGSLRQIAERINDLFADA